MPNYFVLKKYFVFSREMQIIAIMILFVASTWLINRNKSKLHKNIQNYSYYFEFMFAPIYEEIIFRGLLFVSLINTFSLVEALVFSSLAFGIWHYKNVVYGGEKATLRQVIATGLIYGSIFAITTYLTGTIWVAVILHYLNNLAFLIKLNYD